MESPDLKTFDIVPFLARLSRNILDGGGKAGVEMEVQTCALQIGLDFAVPLGLLVTKLVSNSLKHLILPDGEAQIRVSLSDEPAGFASPPRITACSTAPVRKARQRNLGWEQILSEAWSRNLKDK